MIRNIICYVKRWFSKGHWIIISYTFFFLLFVFFSNFNILFNNSFSVEYKNYSNVNVNVSFKEINGKIDKYTKIKNINNTCYRLNCGFPKEGEYKLSNIEFIKIEDEYFLLRSCINDKECFYNMTDDMINREQERLRNKTKDDLKWMAICLLLIIIAAFIDSAQRKKLIEEGRVI